MWSGVLHCADKPNWDAERWACGRASSQAEEQLSEAVMRKTISP